METTEPQPLAVYKAINAVQSAMNKEGISKGRKNQQQGYAFRGIDDCYAAVAPHLAENQLCIIPRYVSRTVVEHEAKSGAALFYVTVEGEFDFVSAVDGSKHTARMFGEAMDSADKATNKAASAAFKYLLLQTFCIPTEGDNDADLHTPEPLARQTSAPPQVHPKPAVPRQKPTSSDSEPVTVDVLFVDYKHVKKPTWEAWFCTFETDSGSQYEAGTFDEKIAENLDTLKGQICTIKTRPGKKAGTLELLSIEPQDNVPA